jgi:hypothetical protein
MTAILAAVALTAAALGLNAWLVRTDTALDLITPEPVRVVQAFVAALAARRPESAATHLAHAEDNDLRDLASALRSRHGDYRFENGDARRQGEEANVRARLRTERDGTIERSFRLAREPRSRLWKITESDLGEARGDDR